MAVSITTLPEYPTTKTAARVSFALSGGGNYVRVWLTDAPSASKYKAELTDQQAPRLKQFEGGVADKWDFRPDVGGSYLFAIQEITRGTTYGGGYKAAPGYPGSGSYPGEVLVTESTATIRAGQRLEMPVGVGGDTAKLGLYVWDATIRATTVGVHGEVTPALLNPSSDKARAAIAASTVVTALAALSGVAAATALGTLSTVANNIIDKFNAHRVQGGVHAANDTANVISGSFKNASSPDALKKTIGEILKKLDRHMRNDDGNGTGSTSYHTNADQTNTLIAPPPGDIAGCVVALADAWRAYEAHRVQGGSVHSSNDTTNTLTALAALPDLHRAFLVQIQPASPTPPSTANSGVVTLVSGAGMKEST